jgi:hypothetical protein
MKLSELAERMNWRCLTPSLLSELGNDVQYGHASDLLSDVLANAPSGGMLVTIQGHLNTVAVAVHARVCAVVLSSGRDVEAAVIERATEEKVALFVSQESTFDIVGKLYSFGLRGAESE